MPELPGSRGPLSAAVLSALRGGRADFPPVGDADPYGDDLQLALYCCYEMHYRGFDGVADEQEWNPALLAFRGELERLFLDALRADVAADADVAAELDALLVEPVDGHGVSFHLRGDGERWQVREYVVHRSLYHLKEADPQAFVIPRLSGAAKAGLVTVEHDEYGAGDSARMHAAAVRGHDARAGPRPGVRPLPRRRPRHDARRGQPHVAVRAAPVLAGRARRPVRRGGADVVAGLDPDRPRHAQARPPGGGRRASTPSTSRRTRCTSSSSAVR